MSIAQIVELARWLIDIVLRRSERQVGRDSANLEALRKAEADEERAREIRRQVKHAPVTDDDGFRRD
jgi:hypothetical protein